jgi:hypothetical protein
LKNIQIIDGADNCTYSIYAAEDAEFQAIFVGDRDVEFAEDVVERLGEEQAGVILGAVWKRPVDKKVVAGIHGTLFFELARKKRFYPTGREAEMKPANSYSREQRDRRGTSG